MSRAAESTQPVTVRPGETLWGIARRDLGDGSRWRDIYNLSKGATAPDGHVLTNPNVIWPGLVVEEPAEQSAADGEAARPADADSAPAADEPPAEQVPQELTPTAPAAVSVPSPTPVQTAPATQATPDVGAVVPDSPAPVTAPTAAADEPLEPTPQPSASEYPPQRMVAPEVGAAAGALAAAGLVGAALVLRRRHPRAGRTQPESDVAVNAGFAEVEPAEDLAWRHTRDDLTPADAIAAQLSRAVAAELLHQGGPTADELPLPGASVAAVRHGRSSTTLILQQVPMAARAPLIACLPAAATQAFGDKSDVEGMVSRDGDVLVRLTAVGDQMRPSELGDSSACEAQAWPAPSMLLRLGLLADRQVLAANWDALSHLLVAAPLGQGADAVLGALLASLVAQRSPAQLGLTVLASPRALPEDLLGLPHLLEAPVDPHDEQSALETLTFVREELEERMGSGQTDRPDLVLVLPELGELSTEHMAALGPIMLHGPRHRVRVVAASERRAIDLVQHCPLLSEFGTRLVLRTGDEEESIALLGSGDATELGPGGHLLVRLEGRVPLQAYGYRVAPDRLARLVTLIREHSAAVEWWLPPRLRREPEASEAPATEWVEVEQGNPPAAEETPTLAVDDEEGGVTEEFDSSSDYESSTDLAQPPTVGMPETDDQYPAPSPDVLGAARNGATCPADADHAGAQTVHAAERGSDRVGAEASGAALLTATRPRLRGRFFGAREFLYDGTLIWPTPGAPDEAPMELLVFLGVQDPSGVRAEVLGDSLWEEDDDEARADRLRKRRYRLRRALQQMAPTLEGNPLAPMDKQNPVYRLNPMVIESDVHRFLALLGAAKVLPREEAIPSYEQALELYRGDLLERPDVPPYRWLDEGPRVLDLRVKYARMQQEARRRLANLLTDGPDEGLARAEELYVGLAGENPLDHQLWEALARLHGRRNDLLGLEATVRRLRNALVDLGEADEPDRVRVPPALERVFAEVRASLLAGKAPRQ